MDGTTELVKHVSVESIPTVDSPQSNNFSLVFDPSRDYTLRVVDSVPPPERKFLAKEKIFGENGKILTENLKQHFLKEGRLAISDAIELIRRATDVFSEEPNLLQNLKEPINVIGDIHGQYYDLQTILEMAGEPSAENQFLFLGDYVDRGNFGAETVLLLYSFKINFPKSFFMIRGNHECRHITTYFNFRDECMLM